MGESVRGKLRGHDATVDGLQDEWRRKQKWTVTEGILEGDSDDSCAPGGRMENERGKAREEH